MKQRAVFYIWPSMVCLFLVNLSACSLLPMPSGLPTPSLHSVSLSPRLSESEQRQQQLWKSFQQKPAYTKSPQIVIQTGLLNTNTTNPKRIDLSQTLDSGKFSVQALPQGAIVFQETFTKQAGDVEWFRGFRIPDLSKRYTLHIQKSTSSAAGQIQANLNGNNYVPKHLNWQDKSECQSSGLLLNANNSLHIRLQGKSQSEFTVSVVETGEAGTILKRRGKLGKPGENQSTHIRQNDVNIFNPNDISSLGGLQPYEGESQEPNAPPNVTGVAVDNGPSYAFEAGRLVLRLRQPEVILPILQSKYGATVVDQVAIPNHPELTYYYVEFDLAKSPIANTVSLIEAYRTRIPAEFNSFEFASLSGLQTFVILMDLMVNHEEYIATWELNSYTPAPISPIEPNDWRNQAFDPLPAGYSSAPSPFPLGISKEPGSNRAWWLLNTFTREAWGYSIGTGVNAAYLDNGFSDILSNNNTPTPELGRRLKSQFSSITQNITLARRPKDVKANPNNRLGCLLADGAPATAGVYCSGYHGSVTIMAGFAERDNNLGTAGTSPNANVMPFATDKYQFTYATALLDIAIDHVAANKKYDVIGYNKQDGLPFNWTPTSVPSSDPGGDPYSLTLQRAAFHLISDLDIPIVVAAGNSKSRCPGNAGSNFRTDAAGTCLFGNFPSVFDGEKSIYSGKTVNIIIAGGAVRDSSQPQTSSHANPNPGGEIASWNESTIGKGYIWVPASVEIYDLGLSDILKPSTIRLTSPTVNRGVGTSYSCPMLTGIVALMKSRNPYLTVSEIEDILKRSPTKINITHESLPPTAITNLTAADYVNQPFVDAWDAVEQAIGKRPIGSNTPSDYEAKPYFAWVNNESGNKVLRLNKSVLSTAGTDEKQKLALRTVADNIWNTNLAEGQLVKVRGWSGIDAGREPIGNHQLEILDVQPICNLATCPSPLPSAVTAWFAPEISTLTQSNVVFNPSNPSLKSFDLEFTGKDIVANLLPGKEAERFKLFLKPVGGTYSDIPIAQDQILEIANDGRRLKIHLKEGQVTTSGGHYIKLLGAGKETLEYPSTGGVFNISSIGDTSGGFNLASISGTAPATLPPRAYVWLTRQPGQEPQPIQPGQMVGMGINASNLEHLQIRIDGRDVPIREFVQQTQNSGYVLFQVPSELDPGVKDMILELAGQNVTFEEAIHLLAMPNPVEIQRLNTTGGFGLDQSGINGDIYLGIANRREGEDFSVDSEIFKWNGSQFNFFQSIPTVVGSDMEFFEIGTDRYLAVANASSSTTSKLYKWNGSLFALFQSIGSAQTSWKHFTIAGQHYLVGTDDVTSSTPRLYQWNGSSFQSLAAGGLTNIGLTEHVDAFEIGGETYLAFAVTNHSGVSQSRVLKWNGTQFVSVQQIPTVVPYGVEAFEMQGENYLIFANHGLVGDYGDQAVLYKWNGTAFSPVHTIPTAAAHNWKHFQSQGVDYLILASGTGQAQLYYWDGEKFKHFRILPINGFWEFDYLDTGSKRLLIGSFYDVNASGFAAPSYVYEFR